MAYRISKHVLEFLLSFDVGVSVLCRIWLNCGAWLNDCGTGTRVANGLYGCWEKSGRMFGVGGFLQIISFVRGFDPPKTIYQRAVERDEIRCWIPSSGGVDIWGGGVP